MNPGTHESQDLLIPGLTNPGIHEPCDSRIIGLKRILGVPHSRDSNSPGIQALFGCNASRHSTHLDIPPVESRDPHSWDSRQGILSPGILSPDIQLPGFSPHPITRSIARIHPVLGLATPDLISSGILGSGTPAVL
jgi:hypothetical protein